MILIIKLFLKYINFLNKSICKDCEHKDKDKISELCLINPKITKNYFNGEVKIKHRSCYDKNPNGNCPYFIKIKNN